ncbi:GDP-mannose dehydrogenase [Haematobacter missouriensis]|uniref:UDP-glucose 6-dehydrogenase n=1 Tax=Haematobacter missouriensis TaxID=366616 RepID=A0A212ARM0_9RHOB|nr:nucleotide sugar dehydrogenase [Haematobacter missouriensis]OWJ84114.1 GDP-mannose dehydrogenase [Haematobacter missouriensis]
MKIAVFGLGYVGFTGMCCMASQGHEVVGFDVSAPKVEAINAGRSPITEPGIDELHAEGLKKGLISAHTAIGDHLSTCDMAIVCVGTPSAPDGSHNMSYIAEVSRQIAQALPENGRKITVTYRSTIRPGSMEHLIAPIFENAMGPERFARQVELVYNPEFLREGTAIKDYFHPPKIVVGTKDGQPSETMNRLNEGLDAPVFNVTLGEAQITKFVDNTWHAVKVAFANEVGRICLQMGLSAQKVHEIFVSDTKLNISAYYMRPGGAFGGSCLPKDVRAFQYIAADAGANTQLINSLLNSNEAHKYRMFQHAVKGLKPGAKVLLAGIAFKADTDDLRESPNIDIARNLLREGYDLSVFDPAVEPKNLVGANLGYAFSTLPELNRIFVTKEEAEATRYDRVLAANATVKKLALPEGQDVVNLGTLA